MPARLASAAIPFSPQQWELASFVEIDLKTFQNALLFFAVDNF